MKIAAGFALILAVCLWLRPQIRYFFNRRRSGSWPLQPATVRTAYVVNVPGNRQQAEFFKVFLGYEFAAASSHYGGLMVLKVGDRQTSEELCRRLMGAHLKIRYNPANPDQSFNAEDGIESYMTYQDPWSLMENGTSVFSFTGD